MTRIDNKLETNPRCPSCNRINNRYTAMEVGTHPDPDEETVCFYCDAILQYTDDMHLKYAAQEAIESVENELRKMLVVISEVRNDTKTKGK